MYKVNEYEVNEDNRLATYLDETYYGFDEVLGDMVGMQPFAWHEDYRANAFSSDDDHRANIARLVDAFHYYNHPNNYLELRERAISLYFSLAGLYFQACTLRGNSQGDAVQVFLYGDGDWATSRGLRDTAEAWFSGEVYLLAHEVRTVWRNDDGETMETWDIADSVGCMLFDDEYTPEVAGAEHFQLEVVK